MNSAFNSILQSDGEPFSIEDIDFTINEILGDSEKAELVKKFFRGTPMTYDQFIGLKDDFVSILGELYPENTSKQNKLLFYRLLIINLLVSSDGEPLPIEEIDFSITEILGDSENAELVKKFFRGTPMTYDQFIGLKDDFIAILGELYPENTFEENEFLSYRFLTVNIDLNRTKHRSEAARLRREANGGARRSRRRSRRTRRKRKSTRTRRKRKSTRSRRSRS